MNTIPINVVELLAALMGTLYWLKNKNDVLNKLLVLFLWINFLVEIIGIYPTVAYYTNYEYFSFVKDTPFKRNKWMYNIFIPLTYFFYAYYFRKHITNELNRKLIKIGAYLYLLGSTINLLLTDVYFTTDSKFSVIVGSALLLLCVFLYYFELLRSNYVLELKQRLSFYVSVGLLVFTLCATPILILSHYFSESSGNSLFIALHGKVILGANIFMYLTFALGFYLCSKKK